MAIHGLDKFAQVVGKAFATIVVGYDHDRPALATRPSRHPYESIHRHGNQNVRWQVRDINRKTELKTRMRNMMHFA